MSSNPQEDKSPAQVAESTKVTETPLPSEEVTSAPADTNMTVEKPNSLSPEAQPKSAEKLSISADKAPTPRISISQEKDNASSYTRSSSNDLEKQTSNVSNNGFSSSGNVVLVKDDGSVVRMPIPSNDPNDPLNFSKAKKMGILICCCWFSIFSLVLVGGIGPLLSVFAEIYLPEGKEFKDVANLSNFPSLSMACGAFLILPAAMIYGRRPTFLFCSLFLLASTIGAGASKNYEAHMACRILQGIATGATESVLPLIITDISFLDERGFYYGIYWGSQAFINTAFLISNSYLVAAVGWRWFYWLLAILTAVGFVIGFFVLVETQYKRVPTAVGDRVVHTDEWGMTRVFNREEAEQEFGVIHATAEFDERPEKKSYLQVLNPWSGQCRKPLKIFLDTNWKMLQCLTSPAIIFAILLAAIGLGVGIAMALTYSIVLTTRFGWSFATVGNVNIGIFPAAVAATIYTGYFGDKLNIWLARRRGGVHKPEDTLVQLILPFFIGIIGIVVYAVTAQSPEKYSYWGIIMGWTLYNFSNTTILVNATQFGAEAYPRNPGPGVTIVVGVKNIVAFGAGYGIIPMTEVFSYFKAYMVLFAFYVGILLLGIPVYYFNPKWREVIGKKNK